MSGSAFAVTHHAFSSGAGRTSDGNGSHASTLKSPSYTKSVSWQHYPLRSQMTLTRLSKEHIIDVHLREYGRTEKQKCTFVFQPEVSARVKNYGDHFTVDSIRQMWDAAIKRAGLRHRKSYQSRHTYACWSLTAGANPAFIANQMGHADAQMVFQVYGKWMWICPYISRHLLSLNPLQARCRRYSRGER